MAVKVMVAPAIVRGEIEAPLHRRQAAAPQKPRRRRSAVYDADGNEVFITLMCQKCHKMRPLSLFGLRKMSDGSIRNQPWCRNCRSGAGAEKPGIEKSGAGKPAVQGHRGSLAAEDSLAVVASPETQPSHETELTPGAAAEPPRRNVAAEVAAALAAGRG
jgi:hypothetical protein